MIQTERQKETKRHEKRGHREVERERTVLEGDLYDDRRRNADLLRRDPACDSSNDSR